MRFGLLAATILLVIGGAACSSSDSGAPPVIVPNGPGEEAQTISPGEASSHIPEPPNEADRSYVAMMIAHHQQALVMTELAPTRAANSTVKGLADRIEDSQKPEIGAMEQWQKQFGQTGASKHDHSTMPGMASSAQLEALKNATGGGFDRMFLELMIVHHEGAVKMATDLLGAGKNVLVEEMANDVIATQSDEIKRMRDLLPQV